MEYKTVWKSVYKRGIALIALKIMYSLKKVKVTL
jgi:hypothetical protein